MPPPLSPLVKFIRRCLPVLVPVLLLGCGALQAAETVVIGFSEPVEMIDLSAAEAGVVEEMRVHEGQKVEAGELLGRLDTGVLEATLKMAEIKARSDSAVKSAQSRHGLRVSRLQKLERLASS